MIYTGKIYHASLTANLTEITPHVSRSYKSLEQVVFGSPIQEMSASSLFRDSDIYVTRINNGTDISKLKLEILIKNKNTNFNIPFHIYEIENNGFHTLPNRETKLAELVCSKSCKVLHDFTYPSWFNYMKSSKRVTITDEIITLFYNKH